MGEGRLANLALSENGFLFDTTTGHTYTLNKTGSRILRTMIEGTEIGNVADDLCERFEVAREVAERDVEQFLVRLSDLGIVPITPDLTEAGPGMSE